MTATLNAYGLRPAYNKTGGTPVRQRELLNGIFSGFATSIFTHTPVKYDGVTNLGTIIPVTTTANDPCVGVFLGCEFSSNGKYFVLPYWPASQTYDSVSPMRAYFTDDPNMVYEAFLNGSVTATAVGQGANLANNSQGSTFTGFSTQSLNATLVGATAATFRIVDRAPYDYNQWGDAFVEVQVVISNFQGQIA